MLPGLVYDVGPNLPERRVRLKPDFQHRAQLVMFDANKPGQRH
tara:strand:- start:1764 stop:1892 length:129 start_codon:yes stop_codon:yes gene_type:complete